MRHGEKFLNDTSNFDSLSSRHYSRIRYFQPESVFCVRQSDYLQENIRERYLSLRNYLSDLIHNSVQGVTAVRMWNVSIIGALIFGMFLMTMIYRYLGQGAAALSDGNMLSSSQTQSQVAGAETVKNEKTDKDIEEYPAIGVIDLEEQKRQEEARKTPFEKNMEEMVAGYPIKKMIPYIAKKDKTVAAFMVSIAKKESDWGKHVPALKGREDCYNYWGFKAKRDQMGTGGHTCFDSPQDAVDSVARRLESLVKKEKVNTPKEMVVVWKCGYDCSWDSPKAVNKWVSDVDKYFSRLMAINK